MDLDAILCIAWKLYFLAVFNVAYKKEIWEVRIMIIEVAISIAVIWAIGHFLIRPRVEKNIIEYCERKTKEAEWF